jgi:hypothetical protein
MTSEPVKPLSNDQRDFINFIEHWWFSHSDINSKMPTNQNLRDALNWDSAKVGKFLKDPVVNKALENRGITLADITLLLPEQLAVANSILDFSDNRSQKKKLEELGVTTQRYQGWLKQERFQRYLKQRAEALLGETQHEAHTSLLRNVQRGDLNSIKLYYEMTGRWSSKTVGDLNIEFILVKVVEAVQKHVKDPVAIQAIATELSGLIGTNQTNPQPDPQPVEIKAIDSSMPTLF